MKSVLLFLTVLSVKLVICRDFYTGMFKKNDILVASDRLYKPRIPFRQQYDKYGRKFPCQITYIRMIDRLGYGAGPKVQITRGGLRKKFVVLRIHTYNSPISVNIYVGCTKEKKRKKNFSWAKATTVKVDDKSNSTNDSADSKNATASENSTIKVDGESNSTDDSDNSTDSKNSIDGESSTNAEGNENTTASNDNNTGGDITDITDDPSTPAPPGD